MSPFEYFIRLDYLEYKESFVVPRIGFRGWCVIPDISYLDQVVVNPLLFSISEQRSDFHKGTVASNVIKLVEPLKIKFYPTKREVGLYDSKLSGLQLIFEGEFRADISQGRYAVILDSTLNKYRALSNQWEFDLAPESSRFQPRGGFLSPRVSWLKSSYFIIAGWAYREGDKIADVELLINNNKFDRVILGLNSKYLKETLLNVTNADGSVFTRLICANELADSSAWLNLRAKIRFQSNQQLELNYPAFRLEPATKNCAYLESAFVDLDGVARVRGYSMFGDVGLNTAQGFIHLPRVKGESNEHYPEASLSRSFDTELKLAKLPGKVQVYLRTAQGWKPAKPKFLQKCLQKSLLHYTYRFSLLKGMLNQILFFARPTKIPNLIKAKANTGKIFVATHNLSAVEGAPKVLYEIFSELRDNFEEILVVSPVSGELEKQWREIGARVEVTNELSKAQELLYDFNPVFVFANTISSFWAVTLAAELNLPSIWTIHESVNPYQSMVSLPVSLWMNFIQALKIANKVCFVSLATEKLYKDFFSSLPSLVIPNAIDPVLRTNLTREQARAALGLKDSDYMLLSVGTTAQRKGQDLILREFKTIEEKINKKLKCFFIGAREGDYLDQLRVMADGLEVSFIPETPETEVYYLAADLKVIASREESAPLVSLEAMKYGLPIVSTNVFGLAEQMQDRESCLFFDYQKSGDLTEKVVEIFGNHELRAKLIENGKELIKNKFSKSRQIQAYKNLILGL